MNEATTVLRDVGPLALRGHAAVYPGDLAGDGARIDAERAHAALYGPAWRATLAARGRKAAHVAEAYGVTTRGWCRGTALRGADLAVAAGQRALDDARWRGADVGVLVVATSTPDRATQCLAAEVAARLAIECAALDVRGGGAGGLDAWITGALYARGGARRALVIAVEVTSPWLDASTGTSALLFGDGAGALAFEATDQLDSGGLTFAAQGAARAPGRPFTVPGALPPRADQFYVFQAPDEAYQSAVAETTAAVVARLAGEAHGGDVFLPYSVMRDQVRSAATALGCDPTFALAHLARRGALGCAGPLAALAELLSESSGQGPKAITSFAVGGGLRWAALRWSFGRGISA